MVVIAYEDSVEGTMIEGADGSGRFIEMLLRPRIGLVAGADAALAERLHQAAHAKCFIANSVNFPVTVEAQISMSAA